MTVACFIYLLAYGTLMLLAASSIPGPNRNRGIILSAINVTALVYLLAVR